MGIQATPMSDIPSIVAQARATFNSGKTRPLEWRLEQIRAMERLLAGEKEAIIAALQKDLGRPKFEAVAYEYLDCVGHCGYLIDNLETLLRSEKASGPVMMMTSSYKIVKDPLGVVCIIAPWNFPIGLALVPLLGAVACGNSVVLKPSEVSENCSRLLAEIVPKYLDPDACKVVQGGVDETKLVLKQRFDHIFYTGNSAVAKEVMAAAALNLTPVTLELGGKSPVYVAADANIDAAAKRIAATKCINSGQMCIAPDYVLVDKKVEDEFLTQVNVALDNMFGKDAKASESLGRMINERHVDRVMGLLKEDHGGQVLRGGVSEIDRAARYVAPTIVLNPKDSSRLMQEEIFAPILVVRPVSGLDEAVGIINARETPLAAYCFTQDERVSEEFLAKVPSGGAAINDLVVQLASLECPFGGKGHSGIGNYRGRWSIETFTHRRTVVSTSTRFDVAAGARPPYKNDTLPMVEKLTSPELVRGLRWARYAATIAMVAVATALFNAHVRVTVSFM